MSIAWGALLLRSLFFMCIFVESEAWWWEERREKPFASVRLAEKCQLSAPESPVNSPAKEDPRCLFRKGCRQRPVHRSSSARESRTVHASLQGVPSDRCLPSLLLHYMLIKSKLITFIFDVLYFPCSFFADMVLWYYVKIDQRKKETAYG
ncbi:hypothetical protein DFP93_12126 [Aneurinibacillus soli]|uniref:Uncharacterized protein n=1 Tax=Aneurinibacillus soli TaxID=1500254 RepID=A0A0U5AS51_9BACL|nr:hypothetical protein DFP93_12126 [Aneurinibacillus soli]BAU26641.1 hypothetical protein CB4_00782 [Aneurinibacillus soli]